MEYADPKDLYDSDFREKVQEALSDLGIEREPVIERPKKGLADLCLVCFPFAKELSKPPRAVAEEIMERVGISDKFTLEVKGGYLNCMFRPERYTSDLASFLWSKKGELGKGPSNDKVVVVEHTSANPNGPFHVGRARNPIIGDTLVRILDHAGYNISSQYWINDMGKQVMILVWGIHNIDEKDLPAMERKKEDHDLVRYYQKANALMESDERIAADINSLLADYEMAVKEGEWDRVISRSGDGEIRAIDVRAACDRVLSGMKNSLTRLNISDQQMVYESQVVEDGSLWDVIDGLKKSSLYNEEDGASFLDLSELIEGGDDDRFKRRFVFTRSDGTALYTTRDLAYHKWKLDNCDLAVNVLGEDHRYQSKMLELALRELGSEKVPEAVFYSFVSLPDGKMSTRRGRVVYLDDLLDDAVEMARKEVEKRRKDLPEDRLIEIAETVGIGALRFNIIKVQPEKKIVFKWEEALNFEGASAPFVQYSHARACSILQKAGGDLEGQFEWSKVVERSEQNLLKKIAEFSDIVEKAAVDRKVHFIAVYVVEVASAFNDLYRDCPVIGEEDPERRRARLALVEMAREVLATGLGLLGVSAPVSM